jgi:hypothetical protein
MCAHGSEWVFSPTAAVDLSLRLGSLVNKNVHLSVGGDEVCPDPVPSSSERNFRFYQQLDLRSLHVFASVGISVGTNCVPHPTQTGQAAIAADFQSQGG